MTLFAAPGSYSFTHTTGDQSIAFQGLTRPPFPTLVPDLAKGEISTGTIQVKIEQGEVLGHRALSV